MLVLIFSALLTQLASIFYVFIYRNGILIRRIIYTSSYLIYLSFFIATTYNTDWEGYLYIFNNDKFPTDFIFRFLSLKVKSYGFEFIHVFRIHILFTGLFFINFFSKFTRNTIFITIMVVLLSYVPLCNQIRYFLGFSIFLNGFYYLHNRKILGFILLLLSVFCHIGLIPLILVTLPFSRIQSFKKMVIWSITLIVILSFCFKPALEILGISHEKLDIYLGSGYSTSFAGSLFQLLPVLILVLIGLRFLRRRSSFIDFSGKNKVLISLAMASLVFIPFSFVSQIIFWRYTFALFFIWALIVMRLQEIEKRRYRVRLNSYLFSIQLLLHVYYWVIPIYILDSSDTLDKMKIIIDSMIFEF